jgi:hypothetical protein
MFPKTLISWLILHKIKPEKYTVIDVAQYLGISKRCFFYWLEAKRKIPLEKEKELCEYIKLKRTAYLGKGLFSEKKVQVS